MARDIQEILEEQIARWHASKKRRAQLPVIRRSSPTAVTFSQAHQCGGKAIAERVGELLRMSVFDREIVERIANTAHVQTQTVETLDEHVQNRIDEFTTGLLRERNFDRSEYLVLLSRTVVALWEHGPAVLVGHGSVHIVPRTHALAVRLVAPDEVRIQRLAKQQEISEREAARRLRRVDAEREAFHRRFFGAAIDDPTNYDLVINTDDLDIEGSAQVVVAAYEAKLGTHDGNRREDFDVEDDRVAHG